jgi:hypothetical protein
MRRKLIILTAGVLAIWLLPAAGAGAATVTIGSPLTSAFENHPAGTVGTNAMVTGPNIASPVDGTVVNWRTQNFTGTMRVRILQLSGAHSAVAVASSSPIPLSGGTVDSPISLPIKKGQVVGFDNTNAADRADVIESSSTFLSAGWEPALPDNGTPQAPDFDDEDLEFAYNATVRYCLVPDIVGKTVKAAKTALANAGCTLGTVTKKKPKKGKGKKGKKVIRSQSAAAGTSLTDGAPVNVRVKVKKHKKK